MDFQPYFPQEWKPVAGTSSSSDNISGAFGCNICFDCAQEPVVTFCGHLYCWPCIFKWLNVQSSSLTSNKPPQCPVCKAGISQSALIPLYGRGQSSSDSEVEGKSLREMMIPPRPVACGMKSQTSNRPADNQQPPFPNAYRNHHYNLDSFGSFEDSHPSPVYNFGGPAVTGIPHPIVGMFGEMVYARVFGNPHGLYSYPNSYHLVTNSRWRRQEMQADKSLSRISLFLFFCILLCLIVF